jgi:glutamate synthase domain-containing protein 3
MKSKNLPSGWDDQSIQGLAEHYDHQTDAEAAAEHVAAWSARELDEALKIVPLTGAEIVEAGLLGGWANEGITDGELRVEELRRKRREQRSW